MDEDLQSELTALQEEWLNRLRACEASGMSVKAFAECEGIDRKRLYNWRKVLTRKGLLSPRQSVRFQRVAVQPATETTCACQVQLPNGVVVSVHGKVESAFLRKVFKAAATLS